jgi:hypothetical protein
VKLRLEIFPLDMRPSFQTAAVWEIEPAAINEVEPGKVLSVKFDENEQTRIYPLMTWAQATELYRQIWLES